MTEHNKSPDSTNIEPVPAGPYYEQALGPLSAILDRVPAVVFAIDGVGRYVLVNERWERLFQKSRHDVIGRCVEEVFPEHTAATFARRDAHVLADLKSLDFNERIVTPHGERLFRVLMFPLQNAAGQPYAACGISTDITEQVVNEETVRRQEQHLRIALDVARMLTWDWDIQTETLTWDGNIAEVLGLPESAMGNDVQPLVDLVHPDDRQHVIERLAQGRAHPNHSPFTFRIVRPDGQTRWLLALGRTYEDSCNIPIRIVGVAQDITERALSEQALRSSEAQYRLLFDHNPHPMWVYDAETHAFLAVNDAMMHMYGYSRDELLSMRIEDIRPAEEVARLHEWQKRLDTFEPESIWRHKKKDGTIFDAQISSHQTVFNGRLARFILAQDITARRLLEAQLREAQKLEAIGRLAGGVAHDFNNLLTAILGYTQLIRDTLPENDLRTPDLDQILYATRRAADLTGQLLTFARRQIASPEPTRINDIIVEAERLLHHLAGHLITLELQLEPEAGYSLVDPAQCTQILVNLVVNARDAMPSGGRLTIETGSVWLGEEYARTHANVAVGRYVLLSVRDTGIGMDDSTRAHLFEPFYTTKPPGKGTGLGLSVVHGIVSQARGHIWVISEHGQGTTFRIFLPQVAPPFTSADLKG
ncbi:MAG TPA: PAS domain S-box protein [Roseiflexaceae bacterium]|nr:PAS domain S-box protein [Roseiflexaceae bacterium]